ncbi:MAG: (2Fe-2S)-binding protein [Polyangiaceae bacterium]|jgi:phenylpropionate dioxygenase-like ring-hydroxylating dioxygenase large terminal subunit|nr:(2Fe-2S)-binding protein [Polyangiaceae bacterium]
MLPLLAPPHTKPHLSVAKLTRFYYVACLSEELARAPLARVVCGVPIVLFRSQGRAAALIDRCPHRNVPLSLGRVLADGRLECAYHGWQFGCDGVCEKIPGLVGDGARERRAESLAVLEQDGLVWVCPEPGVTPEAPAFRPPSLDESYTRIVRVVEAEGTLHATLENALDVPHTAFLHRGLFRGGKKNQIRAVVRRSPDRVETEYLGEPRPSGIAGRILSPGSGTIEHWDRFILPSVAQVEYKLGQNTHFLVTALCTPVTDFHTRLYGVASFKTPFPKQAVRAVLEPIALRIFGQDAVMLKAQSDNVRRFGGERFQSTELDFMGPQIWRLLKQAESGSVGEHVVEREVTFWA